MMLAMMCATQVAACVWWLTIGFHCLHIWSGEQPLGARETPARINWDLAPRNMHVLAIFATAAVVLAMAKAIVAAMARPTAVSVLMAMVAAMLNLVR